MELNGELCKICLIDFVIYDEETIAYSISSIDTVTVFTNNILS